MIVTVAGFKGGCGKTVTAIHLAACFARKASTLLVDGDANRSALGWASRGELPFRVVDERQAVRHARDFEHIVVDTRGRPEDDDLRALAEGCDLLVLPSPPDVLNLEALMATISALRPVAADRYKVLLTMVNPQADDAPLRALLAAQDLPVFRAVVHRYAAYAKAALAGVPVHAVNDPRAEQAWVEYQQVGKEILR